jgi:hypothetical protein
MPLDREEYIEQAYFFQTLRERMLQDMSTQDLLVSVQQELLTGTRLPLAVNFLAGELRLIGEFAPGMARLPHYFTPFQTFVISEAEKAEGRFDYRIALEILQREAEYRSAEPLPQGSFLFQFEALCRNRLGYDRGLEAIANDDLYPPEWKEWVLTVRRQVGLVDFCDLLYVRSELYRKTKGFAEKPTLFGEKEGRIALANRRKDPLYLFAALQRHLGYPSVPRPKPEDTQRYLLPQLQRRVERLEMRQNLMEEEIRGGINLSRFARQSGPEGSVQE